MRARRRADAVRMALTPSLARLSLVARTGARASKAAKGERGAKEEKDLGWNGLPEDLWWSIVDAIDEPDACAQIEKMCAPTPEGEEDVDFPWSGWCKDGSLYERISARLGWYGDLPDWKAVEAHYQEGRAWDKRELARFNVFENAKAYFGHVCAERRKLRDAHYHRRRIGTYGAEMVRLLNDSHMRKFDQGGRRYDWYHPYVVSLAKYAVGLKGMALEYVPGSMNDGLIEIAINGYVEIAKAAVRADGVALQFVPGSIDDDTGEQRIVCIEEYEEIAEIALRGNGMALAYVPGSARSITRPVADNVPLLEPVERYAELATVAAKTTPPSLKFVPPSHPEYATIAEVAVKTDPRVLWIVDETHGAYVRIAEMAVYAEPETLMYVPGELPNYALLAELAITINPDVIEFVPTDHPAHDTLEALAERRRANPKYMT